MAEVITFEVARRKIQKQENPIKIIQKTKDTKTGEPEIIVQTGNKVIRTTESALPKKNRTN